MLNVDERTQITIVADAPALFAAAAEEFHRRAQEAMGSQGRFCVALSGGNTPRGVYSLLAAQARTIKSPSQFWNRVYVFFGDERHVPPDHAESNYKMAKDTLLSLVPIPDENVYRIPAELAASQAADQYERSLRSFFGLDGSAFPRFDLILLGLGDDGHTASLFPSTTALKESSRLVVANWVEKFQTHRITLTYPVLNHAAEVMFLVSGSGKSEILKTVLSPAGEKPLPAQAVRPSTGQLLWMVDRDAGRLLS